MNPGTQQTRRLSASTRASRGFSLLEILVVLIILLIGILSVIRLFPGGFLIIQRTGEQTLGVNVAAEQLEAMRSLAVVPDYIVPGMPDVNGKIQEIPYILPDDLKDETDTTIQQYANGFTLPPNYPGYFFSNINRYRYILGETFRVPISNSNLLDSNNVPYGSLATLQLGPVYNHFNPPAGPGTTYTDSLTVYGAALTRTQQSSVPTFDQPDPRPNLRGDSEYAIDYVNHRIAFFPRVARPPYVAANAYRPFLITFDYYDTSVNPPVLKTQTGTITVQDVDPTTVASGVVPQPVWQDITTMTPAPSTAAAQNIRQESEEVSRRFKLITTDTADALKLTFHTNPVTPGPQWSDDPYEYAWYSEQQGSANANVGVLLFNPRGHVSFVTTNISDSQTQAQGQSFANSQAIIARVDYLTFDNHIIRDQRTVPSGAPYTIKLALPYVLTKGDLLTDQTTYDGMFMDAGGGPDVLIYNANDGSEVGEISGGLSTGVQFSLDPIGGSITFDPTQADNAALRSKPLRIFYRTQKNWGAQVQKASSMYAQVTTPDAITYKKFFIGDGTNGLPTRIYFSPSEAGKTITIGEFYLMAATGPIPAPFRNETFKIGADAQFFETLGANGVRYPFIDILATHPQADPEHIPTGGTETDAITGFTAVPTNRAVNYVRGLSIKSRVIWKDTGRYRRIDQDSILPTDKL